MTEHERRFTSVPVEIRAAKDSRMIGGYAAKFNRQSKNLGGFVERIDPAAFNATRGDGWPDVSARWNHSDHLLLGTTAAGTLRLHIDGEGLSYEVEPPSARADLVELVERGDIRKSSFAFRAIEDDWDLTDQGFPMRTLHKVQLVDVAPVNVPAYAETSAGLRSLAEHFEADLDEVRSLAESNDLTKFFRRTDGPTEKKPTPAQLRLELLRRK